MTARTLTVVVSLVLVGATACAGSESSEEGPEETPTVETTLPSSTEATSDVGTTAATEPTPAPETTVTPAATTAAEPANSTDLGLAVSHESELVYLTDAEGEWTLRVTYPETEGPWPLIVVIPAVTGADYVVALQLAARGAVVVSGDNWADWRSDPSSHLYGVMNRAACIVSWAQQHGADYGADPAATTVAGYSAGAMTATWVGLGLADDSQCDEPITHLPVALVSGESQFLFHHERWDAAFESGDPEPTATLDGLLNPERWTVSPELRVGLWSAAFPSAETRPIDDPPGADSWIWLREAATPVVDDLEAVGAFDDERIDWRDNASLMEQRLLSAGIDVRNEVYDIGHHYAEEVYDLIYSIQSNVP